MEKTNLLALERPDLLDEWDYTKNPSTLSPEKITAGSNKKAWWICNNGHSFQQTIYKRVSRNYKCPYCSGKRVLSGFNDIKTLCPKLLAEWDFEKNLDVSPEKLTLHSNKKVWWICSICGNEWQAIINDRTNGHSCPICAKKQRIKSFREKNYLHRGENDLSTLRSDLVLEWNFEKNGVLNPQDFTCNSNERVWWKCPICGNEWQAKIYNRARNNSGCPKCMKHKRTSFPEQALFYYIRKLFPKAENGYTGIFVPSQKELDIFIPEVNFGIEYDGIMWHSNERSRKVDLEKYVICKNNSIKLIRISESKKQSKDNCDYFIFRDGFDDESLNYTIQETISLFSNENLDINITRDRNKIIKQYVTIIKNKSISARFPETVWEWDTEKNEGITPDMVNATTNKKYWWRCKLGHSYQSTPLNKLYGHLGCPICSGHRLLSGFNDLATKYPNLAKQWDYEKNTPQIPSQIASGSKIKYWWKCEKGHSYLAAPCARAFNDTGCPYCNNRGVLIGFNDLSTTNPEMLNIWDYEKNSISPQSISYGSKKLIWWKCKLGHSWQKRVFSQVKYNTCPICTCKEVCVGVNDLATTNPDLTKEWDHEKNALDPTEITKVYSEYIWWKCLICNTSWKQKVNIRVSTGCGCPKCGYTEKMQQTRIINIQKNKKDLQSRFPDIASEWDYVKNGGLTPSTVSYGSNRKVWWLCKNGHSYAAWITDRTGKRKIGCPICSKQKNLL